MSFNAFTFNNTPFWDFFDNINDEVEQFNRLLQSSGFDSRVKVSPPNSKAVTQNGEQSSEVQTTKPAENTSALSFPSIFNTPFFNSSFSVVPPVDVLDNEKDYELHVSIPGAKKDDIKLDFNPEKNEVVISGEIGGHSEEATKNLKLQERRSGKFERRITLPTSTKLDEENINATYTNGVLTLKVPKAEGAPSSIRRIEISSNESWESSTDDGTDGTKAKAA